MLTIAWALFAAVGFCQNFTRSGPVGGSMNALAVDPTNSAVVYAGTPGAGVFKSVNSGASWTEANAGLSVLSINALAIDPSAPLTVYAATPGGVYKSMDGGNNWTSANAGFASPNCIVNVLAIDPLTPAHIYAGLSTSGPPCGGLYKSENRAGSWSLLSGGLPADALPALGITAIAISGVAPTTIYVASGFPDSNLVNTSDVYKSSDGGNTWSSASVGRPGTQITSLVISPTAATTVYATGGVLSGNSFGVLKSVDGGATWAAINNGLDSDVWSVAVDPAAPGTLYAGEPQAGHLFKSTNGGQSWAAATSSNGQFLDVFAFGANSGGPSTIYASGNRSQGGGVFRSTDGAASWSAVNTGLYAVSISSVAIDPSNSSTIYLGTADRSGGVFKSTDGGKSWSAANNGLPNTSPNFMVVSSLLVDPFSPSTLYVAGNCGVYKSTDGASSWTGTNLSSGLTHCSSPGNVGINTLVIDPQSEATLYLGDANGVLVTTDGGANWHSTTAPWPQEIISLAIDSSGTLYAGTYNALSKSTNGGQSWTTLSNGVSPNYEQAIATDPTNVATVYAGSGEGGLFKSPDGGATWRNIGPEYSFTQAIAIDAANSNILYTGDLSGLFQSNDGGMTWTGLSQTNGLLATNQVQALAIDPAGSKLYVGTAGGLFTIPISAPALSFSGSAAASAGTSRTITIDNSTVCNVPAALSGLCTMTTAPGGLQVTSASISGANAADFTLVNHCQGSVAAGSGCTLSVTFKASKIGSETATLTVTYAGETESSVTVNLSGTGTAHSGLLFVPVTPCRVADTRNPDGPFGGPEIAASASRSFVIPQSSCGIPATAAAYSLNVTVVPPGPLGYLSIWPTGELQPYVSTLNSSDGRVKANAAIVDAGEGGAVSVYMSNASHVVLDIDGYFTPVEANPAGLVFYSVTPCRIVDTRKPNGPLGGPFMTAGSTRSFGVAANTCGVPADAGAYSLNFTVAPHGTFSYLSTWPTGQAQPYVSTLNAKTGGVTANAAIVPAGTGGAISVYVTDDADVVVDVNGYFGAQTGSGLSLYSLPPCRVVDTRAAGNKQPFLHTLVIDVADSGCGVAPTARAIVTNATVVPTNELGFLTLWPDGETQPYVSTLNASDGATTSNMAIVPMINGSVDAYATNSTHLVFDASGYFAP